MKSISISWSSQVSGLQAGNCVWSCNGSSWKWWWQHWNFSKFAQGESNKCSHRSWKNIGLHSPIHNTGWRFSLALLSLFTLLQLLCTLPKLPIPSFTRDIFLLSWSFRISSLFRVALQPMCNLCNIGSAEMQSGILCPQEKAVYLRCSKKGCFLIVSED